MFIPLSLNSVSVTVSGSILWMWIRSSTHGQRDSRGCAGNHHRGLAVRHGHMDLRVIAIHPVTHVPLLPSRPEQQQQLLLLLSVLLPSISCSFPDFVREQASSCGGRSVAIDSRKWQKIKSTSCAITWTRRVFTTAFT